MYVHALYVQSLYAPVSYVVQSFVVQPDLVNFSCLRVLVLDLVLVPVVVLVPDSLPHVPQNLDIEDVDVDEHSVPHDVSVSVTSLVSLVQAVVPDDLVPYVPHPAELNALTLTTYEAVSYVTVLEYEALVVSTAVPQVVPLSVLT